MGARRHARGGATAFIHGFGSAPNRQTHFHVCAIDEVLEPDGAGVVRFHAPPEPGIDELEAVQATVRHRSSSSAWRRWCRRRAGTACATTACSRPMCRCVRRRPRWRPAGKPASWSPSEPDEPPESTPNVRCRARYLWAVLLARIYCARADSRREGDHERRRLAAINTAHALRLPESGDRSPPGDSLAGEAVQRGVVHRVGAESAADLPASASSARYLSYAAPSKT